MDDCSSMYGNTATAPKELGELFKMQPLGDPNRLPEERPWQNHHDLFSFCLTKYSNEPPAFSPHKSQLSETFTGLGAESKHKKSINECRGNTEVQHALIKIQLRVYS